MLSSATRKLRFWKKKPDKKKEVTTEDELLFNEIELQRRTISNLKQECARLKELQSDMDQYKTRFELLERKTIQQARSVEKQQSKLHISLKLAEEEIERLSDELRSLRSFPCGSCEANAEDQKKYSLEVSCLQDTVGKLERENLVLQSLVREYTLQASRAKSNFVPILSSQNSIKSDPDVPLIRPDPLGRDKVRRSSLSLNDFLDDSMDVQSEKCEVEGSSNRSSLAGKESFFAGDYFDGCSAMPASATPLKEEKMNSQGSLSTDEGFRLPTIESLIEKTFEGASCSSDVFTNVSSTTSIHELSSTTFISTMETIQCDVIPVKMVNLDPSRSLKNLAKMYVQNLDGTKKYSISCPSINLHFNQPNQTIADNFKAKKRRSLEDPNTLTKMYNNNNKTCHNDLQKAVNFFSTIESDNASHYEETKRKNVITKDKVAALREYFERKNSKKLKPTSSFKSPQKTQQPKTDSPRVKKSQPLDKQQKSEPPKKLCSIPRLNGFRRITKSSPIKSPATTTTHKNPPTPNVTPPQPPRDVRSASVPSPILPNKCKESPQFKIAFMKSTSLRSFNHLPLKTHPHSENKPFETQPSETTKSKKLLPPQKHNKFNKSPIIDNLDKYKLNINNISNPININNSRRINNNPTKRSPTLLVDVSEDASDTNMSNDETLGDDQVSSKRCDVKPSTTPQQPKNTPKTSTTNKRRSSSQSNQPASCQCRSKAQTNKDLKSKAIRTNGSMPQSPPINRSIEDKQQQECSRVAQKDGLETNQTYFYEVPGRKVQSSIPIRSTKTSPKFNNPINTSSVSHRFSPEKFMLPIDHCVKKPPPYLGSSHQRSDEVPHPLNPRAPRDGRTNKISAARQIKASESKKSTHDKHWHQCAKITSNKIDSPSSDHNDETISTDKPASLKSSLRIRSSKRSSRTSEVNREEVCDVFKEISRQLDELTND